MKITKYFFIAYIVVLVTISSGFAAETQAVKPAVSPIDAWQIVKVFLWLMLVLAVLVIVLFIMKHLQLPSRRKNQFINIVTTVSLGTKEKLLLVEVDDKQLLIGATSHSMQTLHVLSKHADKTGES